MNHCLARRRQSLGVLTQPPAAAQPGGRPLHRPVLPAAGGGLQRRPGGPHDRHERRDPRSRSGFSSCERAIFVPFLPLPRPSGRPAPPSRHPRLGGGQGRATGTSGATGAAGREGGKVNGRFWCHFCHCSPSSSGGPAAPSRRSARDPTPRPGPQDRRDPQDRPDPRDRPAQSARPAVPARGCVVGWDGVPGRSFGTVCHDAGAEREGRRWPRGWWRTTG